MRIPLGKVRSARDARCRFRRAAGLTTLARLALPLLALFLAAADAAASTVRPLNLEEMTGRAAQIFVGRCTVVESVTDEVLGVPVTIATFEVSAVLKGAVGRTVTIRQLPALDAAAGGPAGIAGLPALRPGEEVVLFLYGATASRLTAPVGFGQGRFAIVADKTRAAPRDQCLRQPPPVPRPGGLDPAAARPVARRRGRSGAVAAGAARRDGAHAGRGSRGDAGAGARGGAMSARAALAAALVLAVVPAFAGGARSVNGLGQPMAWPAGAPVVYNPDEGPLGVLSNVDARTLVAQAFLEWESVYVADPLFVDDMEHGVGGWTVDRPSAPIPGPSRRSARAAR